MTRCLLSTVVFSTLVFLGGTHSAFSAEPAQGAANPMAKFARMVGGEWKTTATGGTDLFDTWHWGPGQHSLRVMTDGLGGNGKPWRALRVVYWHPGRKQIRSLELSMFQAGVAEGLVQFDGETLEAVVDMYQTGVHRNLKTRWTFSGPHRYRDELLESTGPKGYAPLAAWDRVRIPSPNPARPREVEGANRPAHWKAFEPLLNRTWESGEGVDGAGSRVRSTIDWVPLANGIYVRTLATIRDAEPSHWLDSYVYHHTGAQAFRCLALSSRGGVYEGDVTVLDDGALQLDLKGYEGDRVVPYGVRLDLEKDGTLRQRVWTGKDADRTPLLDLRYKKSATTPAQAH